MPKYDIKRIADPVHGTIGLSSVEVQLLATHAFQRLRNIKQLGLAHFVFPGADYSRLSHCLGVCHVTSRILDSLRTFSDSQISDTEYQNYRLAGLLHDVGHFPFSHAFQDAVSDYYRDSHTTRNLLKPDGFLPASGANGVGNDDPPDHEGLGRHLLEVDDQIKSIFDSFEITANDIFSIFAREDPPRFANLISSDLDADRIDYLLRTARHTGLPYGTVDLEYILSQLRLDGKNRICLTPKALHTAEHFLLGRYFDYQQVSYHKTVAAFEEVLKDLVTELLRTNTLDCSKSGIEDMVKSGAWYEFDDSFILHKIRDLEHCNQDDVLQIKIDSFLRRIPPKLIGSIEFIGDRNSKSEHKLNVRELNRVSNELSEEFKIPKDLIYVWDSKGRSLTKVGSFAPISMLPLDEDDLEQSIRILDGCKSTPIVNVARSLMAVLAQRALYTARLYVLFPKGREAERQEFAKSAREKVDHEYWVDAK